LQEVWTAGAKAVHDQINSPQQPGEVSGREVGLFTRSTMPKADNTLFINFFLIAFALCPMVIFYHQKKNFTQNVTFMEHVG